MKHILIYFVRKYNNNWDEVYKALETRERVTMEQIEAMVTWTECDPINRFVAITDEDYPQKYRRDYYKPPFVVMITPDGEIIEEFPSLGN